MSDPQREAAIQARLDAATPGPWRTLAIPEAESELATPSGEPVDHVDLFHEYVPLVPVEGRVNEFRADMAQRQQENVACLVHVSEADPDVQFIKQAPEDVRWLLTELRRVRELNDNLQRSVDLNAVLLLEQHQRITALEGALEEACFLLRHAKFPIPSDGLHRDKFVESHARPTGKDGEG